MPGLTEELILFLLNEGSGALVGSPRSQKLVIAGSVLMDLQLAGRIDTDLETLALVDSTPVSDSLLDPALAAIAQSGAKHDIAYWVNRTAEGADEIREQAIARLVEREILDRPDGTGFLARTHRVARGGLYPTEEGPAQDDVMTRVMRVLFHDEIPDPLEIAIVCLADSCGAFSGILSPSELAEVDERIQLFSRMDPIGQTVSRLVRLVEPPKRLDTRTWSRNLPRCRGLPLIGNGLDMAGDALAFFVRQYQELGAVFRARAFAFPYTIVAGEAANRFLLQRERFHLNTGTYVDAFRKEFGATSMILGMDGPEHRRMRQAMKEGFSKTLVTGRLAETVEIVRQHIAAWPVNEPMPGLRACQAIVTDQIGMLAANTSPREYLDDLIYVFHRLMLTRVVIPAPIPLRTRKFMKARARVEEFCAQTLVQHQLRRRERPVDLIDGLLELHRADPVFMPETDLMMATLMPFVVGLDTAASTTAAVIYALLKHPELQERARAEADRLFADGTPTLEGLGQLDVTHRIAMEAMRMYPALPAMNRTVGTSFELDGVRFPAGERLIFATTVTHYLPEFFPEPNRFDIDRYLPERGEHRHATAYVPFGLGAHRCLGSGFAEVQIALTVATLLHETVLELDPPNYNIKIVSAPFAGPDKRFRFRLVRRRSP